MKPEPIYYTAFVHTPMPVYVRLGCWAWKITDGMTGRTLASGTALTKRAAMRRRLFAEARCRRITGDCRCDRPVLHHLSTQEACGLTDRLWLDGVPVTVRVDGPQRTVVLHPALALTTAQQVRALHLVCDKTDAPVRWAGVA